MNNSPVDYLLQLPASRSDAGPPPARPRDHGPPFDNHFRRAGDGDTTPAAQPPASSPPDARKRPTQEQSSKPPARSDSQPAAQPKDSDDVGDAKNPPATDAGDDQDDAHAKDAGEVAALLASAGQAAQPIPTKADPQGAKTEQEKAAGRHHVRDEVKPGPLSRGAKQAAAKRASDEQPVAIGPQAVTSDASAEVKPKSEVSDGKAASQQASDAKVATTATEVAPEAVVAVSAAPTGAADESKPHKQAPVQHHAANSQIAASGNANKQAGAKPTAAHTAAEPTAAAVKVTAHTAPNDTPAKDDKKPNSRASASAKDAAIVPTDQATASNARVESSAAPAASTTQPSVSVAAAVPVVAGESGAKSQDTPAAKSNGILGPLARLDRAAAQGARGSHRGAPGEGTPHVDPARFVSRVARAVQTAQERGGPLQLRLSPPELGTMRLELSLHQGSLTAKVETDNLAARQLLLDNLPALRDRLAEQNVKIDRFDVDVRRDASGGQQQLGPQQRESQEQFDRSRPRTATAFRSPSAIASDETVTLQRTITNNSINVIA
jgi:flagellar hook-length control protein FliK